MVSWIWIPVSAIVGATIGVFALALVSINRDEDKNE